MRITILITSESKYLHERCLQLICSDKTPTFEELLDGSFSFHHENIQTFAVEKSNILNDISPEIVFDMFLPRFGDHYNHGQQNDALLPFLPLV